MAFEHNENSGSVFVNDRKERPENPGHHRRLRFGHTILNYAMSN